MPPPPPPPAPPPLPKLGGGATSGAKSNHVQPDRNALLSQIKKGTRLKKAETNDKSAPNIEGSGSACNGPVKRNVDSNKSNGPFPLIPPGGLFAQGIPKLKPTVPRSGDSSPLSSLVIQSLRSDIGTSSLDHLRVGQLGGSRSQPPSPVSKPRAAPHRTEANPNFPEDVPLKGPAPVPPPQNQKPIFRSNTNAVSADVPAKPTVKRSVSQTNLQRPRLARPPPNVKPPPPPKGAPLSSPQTAPPPPPSKPPNILRRQSFGVGENRTGKLSCPTASNGVKGLTVTKAGTLPPPPPPPRNNSAPNDLSQVGGSSPQWGKMNIAPPPPPNRVVATSIRAAPMRPPPPRAPAPPPPPPQHHFPAPPSQMKAAPNSAPPPPTRVSSMKQNSEFEQRFVDRFQPAHCLPKPERYPDTPNKSYPSKAARQKASLRRLPPPPPPQASGQHMLHIQLDSGIFSHVHS